MIKQTQYNVGIYLRLSKDDERAGESVSIENQKLILTKYVEEMRWNQSEIYIDDGYSGTNFDRPSVIRLIDDAKDGKINLILVKDLSRFGRNYIQVGQYTDYLFPMIGCRFIALNDGVDTINNDNDIMPFKNLFNEFQSRDTSKKIKAVKQACANNGMFLGCYAPFGYKKSEEDKHKFVIDENVAHIVKKIFDLRCQGYGYRKIAGTLNSDGIITPRNYYYKEKGETNPFYSNKLWNDITIKKLIRNEVYIGNMVQNKTGKLSYKSNKFITKPADEWIRVENTHEPIIDMATWNLCREIDAKIDKPRCTGNGKLSLFSGLVRCMDCGFKMRYNQETHVRKGGRRVVYISYLCGNYSRSGKSACSTHTIYQKPLMELVLEDIRKHANRVLSDEKSLKQDLVNQRNKESLRQQKNDKAQLKQAQNRLLELDRLMQNLYEDKVLGTLSDNIFKNLMQKYETEQSENIALRDNLSQKLAKCELDEQNIDSFISTIKKYVSIETLDREMLLELIDYIEIGERHDKGNQKYRDITIHYKFIGKISEN